MNESEKQERLRLLCNQKETSSCACSRLPIEEDKISCNTFLRNAANIELALAKALQETTHTLKLQQDLTKKQDLINRIEQLVRLSIMEGIIITFHIQDCCINPNNGWIEPYQPCNCRDGV